MKWLTKVLHAFGHAARQDEERRARRVQKRIDDADPVIREYRKLDGALEIYVRRRARR